MNFKYAIVILGAPISVYGENLRANQKDEGAEGGRMLMKYPNWGPEKWDAAQKRQYQRDFRRRFTNPDRTELEDRAERVRKHVQGERRWNRAADPYERDYGDHEYAYYRQQRLERWCRNRGDSCYNALGLDPVDLERDLDRIHGEHYDGSYYHYDDIDLYDDIDRDVRRTRLGDVYDDLYDGDLYDDLYDARSRVRSTVTSLARCVDLCEEDFKSEPQLRKVCKKNCLDDEVLDDGVVRDSVRGFERCFDTCDVIASRRRQKACMRRC